jgi:hypothetical protein
MAPVMEVVNFIVKCLFCDDKAGRANPKFGSWRSERRETIVKVLTYPASFLLKVQLEHDPKVQLGSRPKYRH